MPNIENAWSSVCRAEALKALSRSVEFIHTSFERDLRPALPVAASKLKEALKSIKRDAFVLFRETAVDAKEQEDKLAQEYAQAKTDLIAENES